MLASTISGANLSSSHPAIPLTVPAVPTGMNAGVCTVPCGVTNSATRAAESLSLWVTLKGSMADSTHESWW